VSIRYQSIPELVLGFDTETTGLSTSSERAISYGFSLYRDGVLEWSDHFFVVPDVPISEGAQRVHGISREDLLDKYQRGEALSVEMGLIRAVDVLRRHHQQGAFICGANVSHFDIDMLHRSYQSKFNKHLKDDNLDPEELRIIDVIAHDIAMESRAANPRRRNLTALSHHYGVRVGGHDALNDAKAACEVFFAQVAANTNDWSSIRPVVGTMSDEDIAVHHESPSGF
jgi:DNA polymerase III epsilon subunit-like protein